MTLEQPETDPRFDRGTDVIIRKYPSDTGKPSPIGYRGRVTSVGAFDGSRGRLYTVALDLHNPDAEVPNDPYSWVCFEDELDDAPEDDS